jgi:peptidoglycan/LPS O-acetylase OafA/YrhL
MNPILELFRGLGAWMVMNRHFATMIYPDRCWLSFLWTGVYLFFVISGFAFAREILEGNTPVRAFAIRRVFRIYPLYFVSLLLYYVLTPWDALKKVYFAHHLFFLHTPAPERELNFFNAAFWSLPSEVEFYFCVPLLAALRRRLGQTAIFLLFPVLMGIKLYLTRHPSVLIYHLPGTAPEFFVGVLMYAAYRRMSARGVGSWVAGPILLVGAGSIVALGWFYVAEGAPGIARYLSTAAYFNTFCAMGYALMILPLLLWFHRRRPPFAAFCLKLGTMSYGVYLFHNLFHRAFVASRLRLDERIAFGLLQVLCFGFAALLYRYIENPFREWGRRLTEPKVAPVVPSAGVALEPPDSTRDSGYRAA